MIRQYKAKKKALGIAACGIIALSSFFAPPLSTILAAPDAPKHSTVPSKEKEAVQTTTPIKHTVVIFGENVSFDHYFGTYPNAKNLRLIQMMYRKITFPEML
ncbi:alkaline phosphatase family protein [Aneurinibacillus terranovensis]|uniref:alkaline phosphatase family protein n=1 Tax=Aneurinibacillus terranovensis TaxID=278991 RepID=UPI000421796F|nr:alkaline phosphatase family protein [Aneurinibacillus terranovensis]